MQYQPTPEGKDPHLWQLAQKRASFKKHLATYFVFSIFFWVIWYFTKGMYEDNYREGFIPWPVWPMLGWGIGIAFHFVNAYVATGENSVDKEYEKLKNQNK